jgi:hypothetical protein
MWLPQPQTWPFLAILFLALFVYLISTEIQSQDCQDRLCYNTTPQVTSFDHPRTMVEKLITTLRVNHNPVEWRKALLIGLFVSFIVIVVKGVPLTMKNFLLISLIVFIIAYSTLSWTDWSYRREVDNYIERRLLYLHSRL